MRPETSIDRCKHLPIEDVVRTRSHEKAPALGATLGRLVKMKRLSNDLFIAAVSPRICELVHTPAHDLGTGGPEVYNNAGTGYRTFRFERAHGGR